MLVHDSKLFVHSSRTEGHLAFRTSLARYLTENWPTLKISAFSDDFKDNLKSSELKFPFFGD